MSPANKAFALLHALTREQIEDMPMFIRRRFAEVCRQVADIAERPEIAPPKSGILHDLHIGRRSQ